MLQIDEDIQKSSMKKEGKDIAKVPEEEAIQRKIAELEQLIEKASSLEEVQTLEKQIKELEEQKESQW